jgi:UDPglucose--hexose-1-phosphate uridylyltransferase
MHQAPVNDGEHPEWHWHMHFMPPLLRSATIRKFMVGYEMLGNPQRDVTAEWAADVLRNQSETHYTLSESMSDTQRKKRVSKLPCLIYKMLIVPYHKTIPY